MYPVLAIWNFDYNSLCDGIKSFPYAWMSSQIGQNTYYKLIH